MLTRIDCGWDFRIKGVIRFLVEDQTRILVVSI
jgi:hypothetical protein